MRIWHLIAGASLVGAGAFGVACSSSSGGGGTPSEGGAEGGEDGGEGGACTLPSTNVATSDAGAIWGCLQMKCMTEMMACACDMTCNSAILACAVEGGSNVMDQTTCITNAVMANAASDPPILMLGTCLATNSKMCGGPAVEAGVEGGAEAGHEGGTSEAGGGEGGGSEGGGGEGGTDGGAG